jgi:hypothetical protein
MQPVHSKLRKPAEQPLVSSVTELVKEASADTGVADNEFFKIINHCLEVIPVFLEWASFSFGNNTVLNC